MIKKDNVSTSQRFSMDSFSSAVNVCMRPHKPRSFPRSSFTVNFHLFTHSDVSYRFDGENDNVKSSVGEERANLPAIVYL